MMTMLLGMLQRQNLLLHALNQLLANRAPSAEQAKKKITVH